MHCNENAFSKSGFLSPVGMTNMGKKRGFEENLWTFLAVVQLGDFPYHRPTFQDALLVLKSTHTNPNRARYLRPFKLSSGPGVIPSHVRAVLIARATAPNTAIELNPARVIHEAGRVGPSP